MIPILPFLLILSFKIKLRSRKEKYKFRVGFFPSFRENLLVIVVTPLFHPWIVSFIGAFPLAVVEVDELPAIFSVVDNLLLVILGVVLC